MKPENKTDKDEAIKSLKKLLKGVNNIYGIIHSVSQSGMSRTLSIVIPKNKEIVCLNWYIERLGTYKRNDKGNLKVSGCGMDMGFHVVDGMFYHLEGSKSDWQKRIRWGWL
ncbi:hypothetical protein M0R04_11095 [Candidatus Dojkabacteria bacterium]|jgi:hypothetical protein|nr:hypothetical protein [Candidatus Dojkabacteria bacterium]